MRKPLVLAAKCRTMSGMRDEAVLSDISASGCCITTRGLLFRLTACHWAQPWKCRLF